MWSWGEEVDLSPLFHVLIVYAASIFAVLLCGVMAVLVLLIIIHKKEYFKRAKKVKDTAEAAYEEVEGVIVESRFTIDANACYSLKQDPVYAEIEDVIKTRLNDAYAPTQHVSKPESSHSSISHQPIADQVRCAFLSVLTVDRDIIYILIP